MCNLNKTNYTSSRVFVTGADGMLGSMICRKLLGAGYAVTAVCHPKSTSKTLSGLDLRIVRGDILDFLFLNSVIPGHDYVIHAAAMLTVWPRRFPFMRKVNTKGCRNVRVASARHGVKRMVYIGSASSFAEGPREAPGNENSPFTGDRFGMDYIDSKYAAQQDMITAYRQQKFPVVIINPTFMIGPFDSGPSSGRMLINYYQNNLPAYSSGGKNFVFSGDVAHAVVNALNLGRLGECYIAGNENLEYREFFQKASRVLGRAFRMKKVPQLAIIAAGAINSSIAGITRRPPQLSYRLARMAGVSQYFDPSKARRELKMPQTPIEEAIEISLNWFRENNYIR